MYSSFLVELHFWLALSGTVIYVFALWNAGIVQGLMWRTYTENGNLAYTFVDSVVAMTPYYIARAIGGLLFLTGALAGCLNLYLTVRFAAPATEAFSLMPLRDPVSDAVIQAAE